MIRGKSQTFLTNIILIDLLTFFTTRGSIFKDQMKKIAT